MYLTIENINNLNRIISEINNIEDEEQKEKFLNEHIEDTALFFDTIKKINKKKISRGYGKVSKQRTKEAETGIYREEEIYKILCEKNNAEIIKEYSLSDLKKMYASIYKKSPTSSYTKERIVEVLRNIMHTMKRAEAFAVLAEEREKKKENSY